jgi:hypothetical protein
MKAYDPKVLLEKLKKQGLPVLEDGAEKTYVAVKEWIKESALESENKYDDLGIPFINYVDQLVMPQLDKIDGQEG